MGHKAALAGMLASPGGLRYDVRWLVEAPVQDYKVADHLVVKPLGADSTFQDVCIFASRKEQRSHELYRSLAEQNEGEMANLFEAMAKEDLCHKKLVEDWYEKVVFNQF